MKSIKNVALSIFFFISHLCLASDMANKGQHFLDSPPQELLGLHNPKVVSFGCGRTAHHEISKLQQIFGPYFSYVCIEKDQDKLKQFQIQRGSTISLHAADGSDLKALLSLGLKLNDFDVALVRHPDFHTYSDAFKNIFRKVIPQLLKRNGILAVSLVHEDEEIYVAKKQAQDQHTSFDTLLFELQYNLIKRSKLPHVDNDLPYPGSGRDKLQYYFQNRCNRASEKLSVFTLNASSAQYVSLPKLIYELGGSVVEQSESTITLKLNPAHLKALVGVYAFDTVELTCESCQNPGCKEYETVSKKLMRCDRCKQVSYCSKECQKNHWVANHKYFCHQ